METTLSFRVRSPGFGGFGGKRFITSGLQSRTRWDMTRKTPSLSVRYSRSHHGSFCLIWGFPKIRGTILGVPIIRTIVFWGLYWGPPI